MRWGGGETAARASTLPPLQQSAVPPIVVSGADCGRSSELPLQCAIEAQTGTASRQASRCIATARVRIRMRRAAISSTGYTARVPGGTTSAGWLSQGCRPFLVILSAAKDLNPGTIPAVER